MKTFLLLGMTGVGKSSFINSVFGDYVAETAEFEACTKVVNHYAYRSPIGNVRIIDTPGLGEEDLKLDDRYLNIIHRSLKFTSFQLIYVTRLNETRFRASEKRTIQLISQKFGKKSWKKSWIVFTFASLVASDRVDEAYRQRTSQIQSFIADTIKQNYFSFTKIALIDNEVDNWCIHAKPVNKIFER